MQIGDTVTVKIDKQPVKATIVGFWSKNGPFLDVRLEGLEKVRCARRDDIVTE